MAARPVMVLGRRGEVGRRGKVAMRGGEMVGKWDCQKSRRAEGISDVRRKRGGREKRGGSTVLVVLE